MFNQFYLEKNSRVPPVDNIHVDFVNETGDIVSSADSKNIGNDGDKE